VDLLTGHSAPLLLFLQYEERSGAGCVITPLKKWTRNFRKAHLKVRWSSRPLLKAEIEIDVYHKYILNDVLAFRAKIITEFQMVRHPTRSSKPRLTSQSMLLSLCRSGRLYYYLIYNNRGNFIIFRKGYIYKNSVKIIK
jgi:hypothetical protein